MNHKSTAFVLTSLLLLSFLPSVAAENEEVQLEPLELTEVSTSGFSFTDIPASGSVTEYACGYSNDRLVRGDDCQGMNANQAPGERWFRFTVPAKSIGNQFKIKIENLGDPHYVDLSVNFCRTNEMDLSEMGCQAKDDMYHDESQTVTFYPILSKEYWIHVIAWDEEKEGRSPGGDLTKVRVQVSGNVDSNADREEPEMIQDGDKFERKVCETGCTTGDLDPVDVFYIEGFAGDEVTLKFGSRENDFFGDLDLRVYYNHEVHYFNDTRATSYFNLDDWYHYDNNPGTNNEGISTLQYTFDTSGWLYIWFMDLQGENEAESYTIEVTNHDTTNRLLSADRDGDGLPDYEEFVCGTDYKDPTDTALDFDGDDICDDRDTDDDNDGISDMNDPCQFSPLPDDHDGDGCDDGEDNDDDDDAITDLYDDCPRGVLGPHDSSDDVDGDGCVNSEDNDDDGDGWFDTEEIDCLTDPLNYYDRPSDFDLDLENYLYATTGQDTYECDELDLDDDNDGVDDYLDPCQFSPWFHVDDTDWTLSEVDLDTDGDGCFNSEDDDDDGDSIPDNQDACPIGLMSGADLDGDGCKDAEDDDVDGDGYSAEYENNCGSSDFDENSIPTGPQWDNDNDQQCDAVDTDDDNDGVLDTQDAFPLDSSEQADSDSDGVGDNLDNDDDNDGIADESDAFPLDAAESRDTDNDGIGDNEDLDDDNDNWYDTAEIDCETNPSDASDKPADFDGDKICDMNDEDIDDDGFSNDVENSCSSDPRDAVSTPDDFDGDGTCNGLDKDDDNDGLDDVFENGEIQDNCRLTPSQFIGGGDTDGDGCYDDEPQEKDIDGDGVLNVQDDCEKEFGDQSNGCQEMTFLEQHGKIVYPIAGIGVFGVLILAALIAYWNRSNAAQEKAMDTSVKLAQAGVSHTTTINDNSKRVMLSQMTQNTQDNRKSFSSVLTATKGSNIQTNDSYSADGSITDSDQNGNSQVRFALFEYNDEHHLVLRVDSVYSYEDCNRWWSSETFESTTSPSLSTGGIYLLMDSEETTYYVGIAEGILVFHEDSETSDLIGYRAADHQESADEKTRARFTTTDRILVVEAPDDIQDHFRMAQKQFLQALEGQLIRKLDTKNREESHWNQRIEDKNQILWNQILTTVQSVELILNEQTIQLSS